VTDVFLIKTLMMAYNYRSVLLKVTGRRTKALSSCHFKVSERLSCGRIVFRRFDSRTGLMVSI